MKIFLIALLSSFSLSAFAQLQVGLKGGYTLAWEWYNSELPDDAQITINSGNVSAMAYMSLGDRLDIGVEPGWARRGAACIPGWEPIFDADQKVFLHYIDVPVLLRYRQPVWNGRLEVFGKAGYGLAYLVKGFQESTSDRIDPFPDRGELVIGKNGAINRIDHGFRSGLGVGIKMGPGQLLLESNFFLGMRDANRGNTSKNRSLNCNIGYAIGL